MSTPQEADSPAEAHRADAMRKRSNHLVRLGKHCGRMWFALTRAEQKAVALVLLLIILGLLVRSWRIAYGAL